MMVPETIGNVMAVAEATPCRRHLRLPAAKAFRYLDSSSMVLTMFDVVPSSSKRLAFLSYFFFFFPPEMSRSSWGSIKCGVSSKPKKKGLGSRLIPDSSISCASLRFFF